MLGKISHSTLPVDVTRTLGEIYLAQARVQKKLENFDVALPLYDQAKETLKLLGSVKEALRKAQDPQTLADETLRAMMAAAYFERGEVLDSLNLPDKARSSYLKAEKWGRDEAKQHRAEAVQSTPSGHSAHSSRLVLAKTAEEKSDLVDYLFEKALLTLSSLKISNNPSLFLVYAHDNPDHGKADAETSKYLIEKLFQIQGFKLHSDQAPMGRPYSSSPEELKKDGKLGDIVTNQLCLLPAQLIKEVKPVDKVVVCSSEVLGSYLEWPAYKKFHQELQDAYHKDLDAYSKDGEQKDASAIRQVVNKFSQEEDYKAGFHHVLTEIAFLQIREKHMTGEHGIIPVSLTPNSYEKCLAHFIPATTVRMEDIPRLEGQAQAGREVHQNQSRHGVLFKLIERLLVGSNEAKTFLDKFWTGHGECISLLNKNSTLGELGFAKLLDGIFDGIQRAQHSQLASVLNQQDQELWVLKADPIDALKAQYLAALTQDEAFKETLQLYVELRGKGSFQETDTFKLLPQVQEFLKDKQVILLTGDSGAGKTTLNRRLEKQLWDDKKGDDDAIPLFISLASIDKPEHDLITKALKKRGLSDFQIQKLKKDDKQRFVFILDGYDEIRQTQNLYLSNGINQSGGWQGRMVISCRSEYLGQDYRSRFQPNPNLQDKDTLFQEIVVQPFSEEERDQYLKKYVKHNPTDWTEKQYQEVLLEQPHLQDLVSNPFLLRVMLEAFPHVEKKRKAPTAIQLRLDLYDQFVRSWFERNQQRLSAKTLTGTQKEIFIELYDDGFAQHGIGFVQELAVHLYTDNGGKPIVEYSLFKDKGSWKDAFFGREEEKQLLRETWPLSRSRNQYRFIHKSLLEYFVARSLFESFDECIVPDTSHRRSSNASVYSFVNQTVLSPRTQRGISLAPEHWVGDLGVVCLLTERVQQETAFKTQLLAIIEGSKIDAGVRQAAANAMTILVRAGVQFNSANLQGIQIPGADLSFGVFDSAQLQGADLRKVNFRKSWLRQANLSGAQMAGVQFGEWPYLQEESYVFSCAYSPDGKTCAIGLENNTISVYDASNWKKIHTLSGHTSYVYSVAYSPSSEQIVSGSNDNTVCVWDMHTGDVHHTLSGHKDSVNSVAYSPSGNQIASGSSDNTVRVWEAYTGDVCYTLNGHNNAVWSVAYSSSGNQIASGSSDNTVRVWDAHTGDIRHTLSGHNDIVWSVAYSPSGDQIVSGSEDSTVRVWDAHTGGTHRVLSGHSLSAVKSVAYSPSGEQIASASEDETVYVWDAHTGDARYTLHGHQDFVDSVAYSPSGNQIASGGWDCTVRLWDTHTDEVYQTLNAHTSGVLSVTYSPSGKHIASASHDNTVRVWDTHTGHACYTLRGHNSSVWSVAYSPSGDQIASSSDDKTVCVWNAYTGDSYRTLSGHKDSVNSVVYSPSGKHIASASHDNTVRVWDTRTGHACYTLLGHNSSVWSVAYSPSGSQIASGSDDKTVRLWDLHTGKTRYALSGHRKWVRSVTYSPMGNQIASGSFDNTVRLWDAQSGAPGHTLEGHTREVNSVVYSPSGSQIASGSSDNTVRLWDIATGQCRAVIEGFDGGVYSVVWKATPDSTYLVTGSGDKCVRQWQVIDEGGETQVRLRWISPYGELSVKDSLLEGVRGLSVMNAALLKQRGAELLEKTEGSIVSSEENSSEISSDLY